MYQKSSLVVFLYASAVRLYSLKMWFLWSHHEALFRKQSMFGSCGKAKNKINIKTETWCLFRAMKDPSVPPVTCLKAPGSADRSMALRQSGRSTKSSTVRVRQLLLPDNMKPVCVRWRPLPPLLTCRQLKKKSSTVPKPLQDRHAWTRALWAFCAKSCHMAAEAFKAFRRFFCHQWQSRKRQVSHPFSQMRWKQKSVPFDLEMFCLPADESKTTDVPNFFSPAVSSVRFVALSMKALHELGGGGAFAFLSVRKDNLFLKILLKTIYD